MKGDITEHVARMGQQGNAYSRRDFCGKIKVNWLPGRHNRKFQDNIEMKLGELVRDELEQLFFVLLIERNFS